MTQQLNATNLRLPNHFSALDETSCADNIPLATLFKAHGDRLRLQIIRLLKNCSSSTSEPCKIFQLCQSAISHHPKEALNRTDLLAQKLEGTAIFYRRETIAAVKHKKRQSAIKNSNDRENSAPMIKLERENIVATCG